MPDSPTPKLADVLSRNVQRLRTQRHWTQDELAERVTALGLTWSRTTVAKIELGQRQVTVEEFVSLALALGITPAKLLLNSDGDQFVTPIKLLPSQVFWQWLVGQRRVDGEVSEHTIEDVVREVVATFNDVDRFDLESGPEFTVTAEARLPGTRKLVNIASQIQNLAAGPAEDAERILDVVAGRLAALASEVRLMQARVEMYRGNDNWAKALEGEQPA